MAYLGVTRLWSNRYHFNGGTPASTGAWTTLFDNITAAEKAMHGPYVTIVKGEGYAAGSDVPVASKTYALAGTGGYAGGTAPGDSALLVRYATAARTPKNHPVYLFNYYHGVYVAGANPSNDTVLASMVTKAGTYAANWISGFSDGTTTYNRAGPNGASATGYVVEANVTHRDFPR
jgi:hypothetical protein